MDNSGFDNPNIEALERLADKLEGAGPYKDVGPPKAKKFNLSQWVGFNPSVYSDMFCDDVVYLDEGVSNLCDEEISSRYEDVVEADSDNGASMLAFVEGTCGTSACACGWAGIDPWFIERGFYMNGVGQIMFKYTHPGKSTSYSRNWDAVLAFFRIGHDRAHDLFDEGYYEEGNPTAGRVARRIRNRIELWRPKDAAS